MQAILHKLKNSKRASKNWLDILSGLICFLIFCISSVLRAQVVFTSPLPLGILQVQGDHADLRLHVSVAGFSNFSYKLSSDIDTSTPQEGWTTLAVHGRVVDTLLWVPKSLRDYSLYWRTGLSSNDTGGIIAGLTPGHIIGIAGQSNAEGFTYDMIVPAEGDIRMLKNTNSWQTAHEPTGGFGGGPWIVMSNILYRCIGDSLPIGIVNAAIGATGLTLYDPFGGQWYRNPNHPDDSSIYGNALRMYRNAGGELECLCWIQGESDASYLPDPNTYRVAFSNLMAGFHEDLAAAFPVFHLQVGGKIGAAIDSWPEVREAERMLPPSILVGTAVGRSVGDELHYTSGTMWDVGRMFAAALLKERFEIDSGIYPPLMPDTIATLDSIMDGSIMGRYCFSLGWKRNGVSVKLTSLTPVQYFGLDSNGVSLDTSQVWYHISPVDPSRVQIGLRYDSIVLSNTWHITYDATAEADRAPLATIDPASGDTIFATAFYKLPVALPTGPPASVKEFIVESVIPNPSINAIHCYIYSYKHETMTVELLDNLGAMLMRESVIVKEGSQDFSLPTGGLASGNYWIVLRDENGNESVQKAVFVH